MVLVSPVSLLEFDTRLATQWTHLSLWEVAQQGYFFNSYESKYFNIVIRLEKHVTADVASWRIYGRIKIQKQGKTFKC